jgi:FMN phosphatase YigB (HAD superfamily)
VYMFYKGIIFDLDGTLYNYDKCHDTALAAVFKTMPDLQPETETETETYQAVRQKLKNELGPTAAAHNKCIYFKHVVESLHLSSTLVPDLNTLYWSTFYATMECYEGVVDFIRWNKALGKTIGILTDYQTEYQLLKLKTLGLLEYVDVLVTSEEVGVEKPSAQMFQTILRKMKLTAEEVLMVGDNYEKDIEGAKNLNILGYWFTPDLLKNQTPYSFNSFRTLLSHFKNIYADLRRFQSLSKYCGERFDLVQAGGGNSSVKIGDDWMCIKASGYNLSTIDVNNGYVLLDNASLKKDIATDTTRATITYNVLGSKRGSIETFMHALLKKYTIHLHPIQLLRALIGKNARDVCQAIYPSALIIDYFTPGIKVCQEIKRIYADENVIFLVNHGLILTSDDIQEIYQLLDDVIDRFGVWEHYKHTNQISLALNKQFGLNNVSYLCEDSILNDYLQRNPALFEERITFPDALIYCGLQILRVFDISQLAAELTKYETLYDEAPKIIIIDKYIYTTSHSLLKCKEIEEVLKANVMILDTDIEKTYLAAAEIGFLNNWDAERYRKLL